MAQALIPPIGTSGIFRLNAPFSSDLQSGMSYRCEAIRRVIDFVEAGLDVYEEIYLPKGLSRAQYEQDAANQVAIVSLVASSGHFVFVPSTFILSYPDIGGVPYTVMVLGLELGAIPNYLNLSGLKSVLANVVRDTIGVNPQIREVAVSAVQKLSQSDHDVVENARKLMITNTQTDRSKAIDYEAKFNALSIQHKALQEYVKKNMPPK